MLVMPGKRSRARTAARVDEAAATFQQAVAAYARSQRQYAEAQLANTDKVALAAHADETTELYQKTIAAAGDLAVQTQALERVVGRPPQTDVQLRRAQRQLEAMLAEVARHQRLAARGLTADQTADVAAQDSLLRTRAESLRFGLGAAMSALVAALIVVYLV